MPLDSLQYASVVKHEARNLILIGENHHESNARRSTERSVCASISGSNNYWLENQFPSGLLNPFGNQVMSDRPELIMRDICLEWMCKIPLLIEMNDVLSAENDSAIQEFFFPEMDDLKLHTEMLRKHLEVGSFTGKVAELDSSKKDYEFYRCYQSENPSFFMFLKEKFSDKLQTNFSISNSYDENDILLNNVFDVLYELDKTIAQKEYELADIQNEAAAVYTQRESNFIDAANNAVKNGVTGVWKIGDKHITNILNPNNPNASKERKFKMLSINEFESMLKGYIKKENLLKRSKSLRLGNTSSQLKRRNSF